VAETQGVVFASLSIRRGTGDGRQLYFVWLVSIVISLTVGVFYRVVDRCYALAKRCAGCDICG
jgi:hypothetical protein